MEKDYKKELKLVFNFLIDNDYIKFDDIGRIDNIPSSKTPICFCRVPIIVDTESILKNNNDFDRFKKYIKAHIRNIKIDSIIE